MHLKDLVVAGLLAVVPVAGTAQDRALTLLVDDALNTSGLIDYMVPRFALKHGLRPTVVELSDASTAAGDAVIVSLPVAAQMAQDGLAEDPRQAFYEEDGAGLAYSVAIVTGAAQAENARLFRNWLLSEIGQRAIASFSEGSQAGYVPGARPAEEVREASFDGDPELGEKLSLRHCGRCHVVSRANTFGGIGSTPSFMALRFLADWEAKFSAFWAKNPHPSFTQIRDVTPPFDPLKPPHIAPVVINLDEVDAILAYVAKMKPKDLGAPVAAQ